jgi:hypothetical protein
MEGDSHSQGSKQVSGAQDEKPLSELQFVTLTGPPSLRSNVTRTIVRSHAMQSFLHKKRQDGGVPARTEPKAPLKGLDEGAGKFKLASWSRKSSRKSSPAASLVHTATESTSASETEGNRGVVEIALGDPEDYQAIRYTVRKAK